MNSVHSNTRSTILNSTTQRASQQSQGGRTQGLVKYGLIFTLIWLLLTKGNVHAWVIGIVTVPLAIGCALFLLPPPEQQGALRVRFTGLIQFLPFFLWESLHAGWDSALLVIHPHKQVKPAFIHYRTQLPEGRPQLYFLHIINLLPGTLSAGINDGELLVHILDTDSDYQQGLVYCEQRIQSLFGLPITR